MSNIVNKVFHRNSSDSKDASNTSILSNDNKNASVNSKSSDLKNSPSTTSSKDLPSSPTSPTTKTAGVPLPSAGSGRSETVKRPDGTHIHSHGHAIKDKVTDLSGADPANITQEVHHLGHVTKETQQRHEVEEVERLKEQHNYHTHFQHHVQPIKHEEHGQEKVETKTVPVTKIHEKHSSTDSDATLLDSVTGGHKDVVTAAPLDRKVVDKGEFVKEIDHHIIKNVIQPVIHQDTHSYNRIQIVIPTTHAVHHAPIVHETTEHKPITKDEFLKDGGVLGAKVKSARELGVLHDGKCERKIDGVAEKLEKELGLSPSSHTIQSLSELLKFCHVSPVSTHLCTFHPPKIPFFSSFLSKPTFCVS